jgi:Uncharacterised nucleotidyltransferase
MTTDREVTRNRQRDDARYAPLLALGSIAPLLTGTELHAYLDEIPPAETVALLLRHKVRMQASQHLEGLEGEIAERLRTALRPYEVVMRERLRIVDSIVRMLNRAGRELGIPMWGIKGLVARRWYPDPTVRDLGDWDVYVHTSEEAWRVSAWLRRTGFTYDEKELPWYKRDWSGRSTYGQVRLFRRAGNTFVFIDIHYGGYSVRHCGLLPIRTTDEEPGWHLLDREQNIVLGVANAAGDHFIAAKDLNDLWLNLSDDSVNWQAVRQGVTDAGLEGFFNALLDRLDSVTKVNDAIVTKAAGVRFAGGNGLVPPLWSPDPRQRWRATCRHAYRYGRRYSRRLALTAGLTAARYYRADLKLRLVDRRSAPLPAARPWRCIRLIPVEQAAKLLPSPPPVGKSGPASVPVPDPGAVIVVSTAAGDLVSVGGDTFVPTVYYDLSTRLVSTAARSCTT